MLRSPVAWSGVAPPGAPASGFWPPPPCEYPEVPPEPVGEPKLALMLCYIPHSEKQEEPMAGLRPLIINDKARAKAAKVLKHAEQNHYRPGPNAKTPGDDDRFVAKLNTYRAVFTFTHSDGMIWRHLTVSVPGTKFPNPAAAFMIAQLFGFTGWDER